MERNGHHVICHRPHYQTFLCRNRGKIWKTQTCFEF